ncbi:MAG: hypothetical protein AVDCRST_MAG08-1382 [uncultured Acetobacteraceae bacterium]|uniref:Uncharacterized protein n=1 Tax=uncultured Acetobacteraceae bacterium TaxID=169975 RepID=A0A6J4HYC6_9PROT|nr:MAG: hypothetical protein AVDCRST_MAG08-1382 [uncultured Acetobacteraceae bacterium]
MFEVVDDGGASGAFVVRGTGGFAGQSATFTGPEARSRAEAYARWLNAGGAFQRRRTDPGFRDGTDPGR